MIWIEIFMKYIGQILAFVTLTSVTAVEQLSLLNVFESIVLAVLIACYFPLLIASISQKELFGLTLGLFGVFAHGSMICALMYGSVGVNLVLFCTAMIVGEVFRLVYLDTLSYMPLASTEDESPRTSAKKGFTLLDLDASQYKNLSSHSKRVIFVYVITMITLYVVIMIGETIKLAELNSPSIN